MPGLIKTCVAVRTDLDRAVALIAMPALARNVPHNST